MNRLLVAWLVLAVMPVLLFFKTYLQSDLTLLDNIMVDIFVHGGSWFDWKITPAPAYFPDMLAYAIGYFVFPGVMERVVFVCLVQALLLAWVSTRFVTMLMGEVSLNARLAIVLLVGVSLLVASNSGMWLFFNSTNNHFAALFFPLFCMAFSLEFWRKGGMLRSVWVFVGAMLGAASTSVFALSFVLPLIVLSIASILVLLVGRRRIKSVVWIVFVVIAGQVLGTVINKELLPYDALAGRAPMTIDAALNSYNVLVQATKLTFSPDNIYTFSLAVLVVVGMAWVVLDWLFSLKSLRGEHVGKYPLFSSNFSDVRQRYSLCVLFLLIVLPVNVAGAVLSGGLVDLWGYRYFAFPVVLGVLLCIAMIDSRGSFNLRWSGWAAWLAILLLVFMGLLTAKNRFDSTGRSDFSDVLHKGISGDSDRVGNCLNQISADGFELRGGIADFWNARGVAYKVDKPVHILPVYNNVSPRFQMMSLGPLVDPGRYGFDYYNFAILRRSGTVSSFDLTPETIGRLIPAPSKVVSCANTDSEVWLYDSLALNEVVQKNLDPLLFALGRGGRFVATADQLPGQLGKAVGTTRVAQAGIDPIGFLSYGPYIRVPAGRYQATVLYSATVAGNKADVGIFADPKNPVSLASSEMPAGEDRLLRFTFELKEEVPQLEVRTWFENHGVLTLKQIIIEPELSEQQGALK
ncbi:hypothetical protein NK553_09705 [Pseudomonas sp. ZM23]|uniref:Uncharacterized protein n=1 Tax=Pseudomonas triclosanedens TaxID=2961893 RepID=A0ABY7A224_9PSED|nr:hypothetical protein [Pseudomonas triclosanedens]MCP8464221.1 hypothetical protein [Pseudomonas triclosanedens]MCP8471355.1 hypothetical protein [Pseudomonas triclosanedens]MCP8477836.1 hypothetical protein [Pseudomonas triclosanedens]WAI51282.1 hypothetical protein OU419_08520 [Pseudomonas triclosanedens]